MCAVCCVLCAVCCVLCAVCHELTLSLPLPLSPALPPPLQVLLKQKQARWRQEVLKRYSCVFECIMRLRQICDSCHLVPERR